MKRKYFMGICSGDVDVKNIIQNQPVVRLKRIRLDNTALDAIRSDVDIPSASLRRKEIECVHCLQTFENICKLHAHRKRLHKAVTALCENCGEAFQGYENSHIQDEVHHCPTIDPEDYAVPEKPTEDDEKSLLEELEIAISKNDNKTESEPSEDIPDQSVDTNKESEPLETTPDEDESLTLSVASEQPSTDEPAVKCEETPDVQETESVGTVDTLSVGSTVAVSDTPPSSPKTLKVKDKIRKHLDHYKLIEDPPPPRTPRPPRPSTPPCIVLQENDPTTKLGNAIFGIEKMCNSEPPISKKESLVVPIAQPDAPSFAFLKTGNKDPAALAEAIRYSVFQVPRPDWLSQLLPAPILVEARQNDPLPPLPKRPIKISTAIKLKVKQQNANSAKKTPKSPSGPPITSAMIPNNPPTQAAGAFCQFQLQPNGIPLEPIITKLVGENGPSKCPVHVKKRLQNITPKPSSPPAENSAPIVTDPSPVLLVRNELADGSSPITIPDSPPPTTTEKVSPQPVESSLTQTPPSQVPSMMSIIPQTNLLMNKILPMTLNTLPANGESSIDATSTTTLPMPALSVEDSLKLIRDCIDSAQTTYKLLTDAQPKPPVEETQDEAADEVDPEPQDDEEIPIHPSTITLSDIEEDNDDGPFRRRRHRRPRDSSGHLAMYRCRKCPYTSARLHNLRRHEGSVHREKMKGTEVKPPYPTPKANSDGYYPCPECKKFCVSLQGLDVHFRSTHNPADMPHHCDVCNRGFFLLNTKQSHQHSEHRSHIKKVITPHLQYATPKANDKGRYVCPVRSCRRQCVSLPGLDVHFRSQHDQINMPHHCAICNRGFFLLSTKRSHQICEHRLKTSDKFQDKVDKLENMFSASLDQLDMY